MKCRFFLFLVRNTLNVPVICDCMQVDGSIYFSNHMSLSECQLNLPVIRVIMESIHKPLSEQHEMYIGSLYMLQRIGLSCFIYFHLL